MVANKRKPIDWSRVALETTEIAFDDKRWFRVAPVDGRMVTFQGCLVANWTPDEAMEIACAIIAMAKGVKALKARKRLVAKGPH